jgi:8-oxo-dGTP pyrophosphatase MutT (NUDIX family)
MDGGSGSETPGGTAAGSTPPVRRPSPASMPRHLPHQQQRRPRVEETSAGGLVVDLKRDAAALIARYDRRGRLVWSLPKGHIEDGETAEMAAIREVEEETGITSRILEPLGTIDFWFVVEDKRVHKTVHHFLLLATGGTLSDEDPEVVETAWVALDDLQERLEYPDERDLVSSVRRLLSDHVGLGEATS